MKRIVLGLALACFAGSASAANWQLINGAHGAKYYGDADDTKRDGDVVTLWIKTVYDVPLETGTKESKRKIQINCRTMEERWIYSAYYDKNGEVRASGPASYEYSKWNLLIPDSIAEYNAKFLCGVTERK